MMATFPWHNRRLEGWVAAILFFGLASTAAAQSDTHAPEKQAPAAPAPATLYDEGVRALASGLSPVAAFKLREFLHLDLSPEQRRAGTLLLVRALLAEPDAAKAQAVLDSSFPPPAADAAPDGEVLFWRGQVQAASGHWDEALASYTQAAESPAAPDADLRAQARFGQGECLLFLKHPAEAADILTPLCEHPRLGETARLRCAEIAIGRGRLDDAAFLLRTDAAFSSASAARRLQNKEHAYLLGRLRLAQHEPVQAEAAFSAALAQPQGLSERLLIGLSWGWAQARIDQGKLDAGEDVLENLIERYPDSIYLPLTFAWLETLYLRDAKPDLSDLRRWTEDDTEIDRQALALLTLGQVEARQNHAAHAEKAFVQLIEEFPDHPQHARALVDLAALRLRLGRPAEARVLLDQARPQVASLAARNALPVSGGGPAAGPRNGRPSGLPITPATARVTSPVEWRTEIDVLDAGISLAEHNGVKAADDFTAVAARLKEGPQAEAAAFDAVLCWLRALNEPMFTAAEEDFHVRFPASLLNAEFALEEGLARASQAPPGDRVGRQRAVACLRAFLRDHPAHPRAPEAQIALAELAFERPQPDLGVAWHEIEAPDLRVVANDGPAGPPAPEAGRARAEYLAIWLADAPGPARDEEKAIALAKVFLQERPGSPLAADVRMKLGEIYFQRADYPDAQTQLEGLAENAPNSPLAESALYLAGVSAASSMSEGGLEKAKTLFGQVAQRGGPMRLTARLRQADVLNQLDKADDALKLYDIVLKATDDVASLSDADLEARCTALSSRGRTLLDLASTDPKHYADAVRTFDQLQNTPGASLLWRRQALTQKGGALVKMGEPDAALAAYDDALEAPVPAPAGGSLNAPNVPEWTWFYRAGRDAARLLESRQQWTAAAAIYKKLAAADGPMKSEFENQLRRVRLEHYIWEE